MARKRKPVKKRNPNQIAAEGKLGEDEATAIARTVLRPNVQAAVTLKEYGRNYGDIDLSAFIDALSAQTTAVANDELGRGEAMLTAQAHTLDAVFNNLARRSINAEYMDNLDKYLKLALRAQSQCRATWETLATMKNPPMMGYVKQANIANGHQQVNNTVPPSGDNSRTRENANPKNKLLEETDDQRLDPGTACTSGKAHPAMAPVGKVDRSVDARG